MVQDDVVDIVGVAREKIVEMHGKRNLENG